MQFFQYQVYRKWHQSVNSTNERRRSNRQNEKQK